jgi:hypothetical protein
VTGLDCDGAESGNWAILDVCRMRWVYVAGRPVGNAVRGVAGLLGGPDELER